MVSCSDFFFRPEPSRAPPQLGERLTTPASIMAAVTDFPERPAVAASSSSGVILFSTARPMRLRAVPIFSS